MLMHRQRVEPHELSAGIGATKELVARSFGGINHERIAIAHLDSNQRCIHLSLHDGSTDSVEFPFLGLLSDVISLNSRHIIVSHNHPSGESGPSKADINTTRKLIELLSCVKVKLLDHLIFHRNSTFSFRDAGLL
jgi:DNA repair protein RadC